MSTRIFLQFNSDVTGITGETQDTTFDTTIELQSFSWGLTNPADIGSAGGGAGAGKVTLSPLVVTKKVDATSPLLFMTAATGKHFAKAQLSIVSQSGKGSPQTLKYEFSLVIITSLITSGNQGEAPLEQVTFVFGSVRFL